MGHQIRTKSPLDDRQFLADVAVAMAQVPLLSGLNAVQHERLARRGRLDYHEPRTKIFVQNTRGDDIIVVLDGEVTLIRQEPDRTTRVISTKAPGSSFGEIGFVTGSPRTLTAIAGRRGALVLKISRAEFENGTRDDPSIGLAVFRELLETIQQRMHGLPPFFRNYLLWGYRTPALETGASESFKPLSKVLLMAVAGGLAATLGQILIGSLREGFFGATAWLVQAEVHALSILAGFGIVVGALLGKGAQAVEFQLQFRRQNPRSCINCQFIEWNGEDGEFSCLYRKDTALRGPVRLGVAYDTYTDCPSFDLCTNEYKVRKVRRDTMGMD